MNEECEKILTISNNALSNDVNVNHFSVIANPLLTAFIKVIMTEDLTYLKERDAPQKG